MNWRDVEWIKQELPSKIVLVKDGELGKGEIEKLEGLGFVIIVYKNEPPTIIDIK